MSINLTDENFDKEISSAEKPVLVDFFATWCEPCSLLSPILDKITEELKDKIIFLKANVDEFPMASQKYGVESIPTIILFEKGKPVNGFRGLMPENTIKEWLKNALKI